MTPIAEEKNVVYNKSLNLGTSVSGFAALFVAVLIGGAIIAFPFMLLWNFCLVPATTGVHEIGFLQSWGILGLCHMVFDKHISPKSK